MSNEVLPFINNEVASLFAAFDNDILADVLRLWDCDAQDWSDDHMIVFRFENDDLLVWSELGGLKARRGPVDTAAKPQHEEETCLAWRPDSTFGEYIGRAELSSALLETFV